MAQHRFRAHRRQRDALRRAARAAQRRCQGRPDRVDHRSGARCRRDARRRRPHGRAGVDRRALPRLLGLRLGDLPGSDPRGGEGRHHDRRRHAAGQAARPSPCSACRRSSRTYGPNATSTTRCSAATRARTRTRLRRSPRPASSRSSSSRAASRRRGCTPGPTPGRSSTPCGGRTRPVSIVVVHCENAEIVDFETARLQAEGRTGAEAWDEARPWYSELEAVQRVALAAEVTGCRTVIAHVTSPQAVERARRAEPGRRRLGRDVPALPLPHDSTTWRRTAASSGTRRAATASRSSGSGSCCAEGHVHTIGSDHAPLPKHPGADIWTQLPGAGNGLEPMLPRRRHRGRAARHPAAAASSTCSRRPRPGCSASSRARGRSRSAPTPTSPSLETNGRRTLDAQELEYHEQEKWSPYDGREVTVFPVYTVLRGRLIAPRGRFSASPATGSS